MGLQPIELTVSYLLISLISPLLIKDRKETVSFVAKNPSAVKKSANAAVHVLVNLAIKIGILIIPEIFLVSGKAPLKFFTEIK